jgi:hypothetical protein
MGSPSPQRAAYLPKCQLQKEGGGFSRELERRAQVPPSTITVEAGIGGAAVGFVPALAARDRTDASCLPEVARSTVLSAPLWGGSSQAA